MTELKHEPKESRTTELAKPFAWPIFGLFVILCFWTSLHEAMDAITSALKHSNTITIGELTLKVEKFGPHPRADVRDALRVLPSNAINGLAEFPENGLIYSSKPSAAQKNLTDTLVKLNLAVESSQDQVAQDSRSIPGANFVHGVHLTQLGQDVKAYLLGVITVIATEAANGD